MMKNRPSDCPSDFSCDGAIVAGAGPVLEVVGGRIHEWDDVNGSGRPDPGVPFDTPTDRGSIDGPDNHHPSVIVRVKGQHHNRPVRPDPIRPTTDQITSWLPDEINGVVTSSSGNGVADDYRTSPANGAGIIRRVARSASLGSSSRSITDETEAAPAAAVADTDRRGDADGACDPSVPDPAVRRSSMPETHVETGLLDGSVGSATPYSLSAVLETIPLAYDPQTRQLCLISLNRSRPDNDDLQCRIRGGDDGNHKNSGSSEEDAVVTDSTAHPDAGMPDVVVRLRSESRSESSSGAGRHADCGDAFLGLQRVSTCGSLQSRAECCSSVSSISSLSTDVSFSVFNDDGAVGGGGHEAALTAAGGGAGASGVNRMSGHHSYVLLDSDEAGFIEINLDQRQQQPMPPAPAGSPDSATGLQSADEEGGDGAGGQNGAKAKRRGLSGLLNRSLLPWKSTRTPNLAEDVDAPGWKLFGKTPPRHTACRDPNKIIEEYHPADGIVDHQSFHSAESNQARQRQLSSEQATVSSNSSNNTTPKSKKGNGSVASSTTALILENRPLNLPAKDPDEELKHRLEYEQMVEFAKKREIKEAKLKKKQMQQQLKHEEQLFLASKIWNSEILPNWETTKLIRKTKDLWWQGIPPSVRGKVWKLAIGNDLHITPELYEICVCRAKDRIRMAAEMISVSEEDCSEEGLADKEGSVELIKLDVSRSFPQLCIFQKGGPYYDMLHSLLGAYVCYRPDVGYVQGMSFLAAVLILNLEVADAFICFANLLNQPCQLAFFRLDEPMMRSYFSTYEDFFRENMPKLFGHFGKQNLSADLYLIDWIYTLYSRSLPLDVASRVWDVFFRDGDEFLFRTALGILRLYEDILSQLDFIHLAQFLTKLPEDIAADALFKSIESVKMICDKHTFAQVLLNHSETRQT